MEKVIVGMSGGVDSAVCALLLKNAGYEVIGVTLRTWEEEDGTEGRCCEIDDARASAFRIGIPFYPINCLQDFREQVVEPFVSEYLRGHTPNPCVGCNRTIKWDKLLYYARVTGAKYVATGHYASVLQLDNGRYTVKKALHAEKDQTYMLYQLTQEQLAATLMPLGEFSKDEVREIARSAGIPVASKPDSQEICFVPDGSYADFIEKVVKGRNAGEGNFVDEDGNILGRHRGIIHYTIGQRKGLGIAMGHPVYVREIRTDRNEVVLAEEDALYSREILVSDVHYMSIPGIAPGESLPCTVKIRYRHSGQSARIGRMEGGKVRVFFDAPVRAATPGQSAVFYDAEGCVMGGGIISEVFKDQAGSI